MFPPIELCYLPPLSPALKKNGDRTMRTLLARALHLLQTRPPPAGCALHQQRLRRYLGRLTTLQPENTVAPARKPKIVCNDERGKTIVAM